jgi:hypothetical protein
MSKIKTELDEIRLHICKLIEEEITNENDIQHLKKKLKILIKKIFKLIYNH